MSAQSRPDFEDTSLPMVHFALDYARRGLPVFPCNPSTGKGVGKRPLTRRGFKDATTDEATIRAWWTQWPDALIGAPMGERSGLFAIDPDLPESPEEPDGLAAWHNLTQGREPIHTHTHETAGGGLHILFRWQPNRPITNKAGRLPKGIDVRGEGGYIIMPPSRLVDGRCWRIEDPFNFWTFAPAPDFPYELLLSKPAKAEPPKPDPAPTERVVDFEARRAERGFSPNSGKTSASYARKALEDECAAVAAEGPGGRNSRLNRAAYALAGLAASGHLSLDEIRERLLAAAHACRLVADDGLASVEATIESGMTAGYDRPREIPDRERPWSEAKSRQKPPGRAAPKDDAELTEDAVARRFAAHCAGQLRYCHGAGAWFEWSGAAWRQNQTKLAFHCARLLSRNLSEDELEDRVKAAVRKTSFAAGVERFCQADPVFAVTIDTWDRDPLLLGTPAGTVDLRTGQLREPDPADGITKLTAVGPAASAACPLWLRFLEEATASDPALIRFLQQWAGYCLTGDTREHSLVFVYGSGGNGKSVFLNVITGILNEYSKTAAMDTFTASFGDKHSTDLAMLRGARLVTASETEEGRAWAEARIKQMTGGDPITARFMRQDNLTFRPSFKLTIVGNHKPVLRNVDDAARRRFNIVPFTRKPPAPDRQLEEKLRAEWPAILRWMIEGCLDWQANGLLQPESVTAATEEYFSGQDLFGQWLEDECDAELGNPYKREGSSVLFASWRGYAERAGERAGSQKAFAENMQRRGFEPCKNVPTVAGRVRGFSGIELRVASPQADT